MAVVLETLVVAMVALAAVVQGGLEKELVVVDTEGEMKVKVAVRAAVSD